MNAVGWPIVYEDEQQNDENDKNTGKRKRNKTPGIPKPKKEDHSRFFKSGNKTYIHHETNKVIKSSKLDNGDIVVKMYPDREVYIYTETNDFSDAYDIALAWSSKYGKSVKWDKENYGMFIKDSSFTTPLNVRTENIHFDLWTENFDYDHCCWDIVHFGRGSKITRCAVVEMRRNVPYVKGEFEYKCIECECTDKKKFCNIDTYTDEGEYIPLIEEQELSYIIDSNKWSADMHVKVTCFDCVLFHEIEVEEFTCGRCKEMCSKKALFLGKDGCISSCCLECYKVMVFYQVGIKF